MSIADVRPYFQTRMTSLALNEWQNPFDVDNIPENIIDNVYQVTVGPISQQSFNQSDLALNVPANLKLFVKAYREHMTAYDSAVALANSVLIEVLNPANRLTQTNIKTINLDSVSFDPLDPTNDNIIVVNMQFRTMVVICPTS